MSSCIGSETGLPVVSIHAIWTSWSFLSLSTFILGFLSGVATFLVIVSKVRIILSVNDELDLAKLPSLPIVKYTPLPCAPLASKNFNKSVSHCRNFVTSGTKLNDRIRGVYTNQPSKCYESVSSHSYPNSGKSCCQSRTCHRLCFYCHRIWGEG